MKRVTFPTSRFEVVETQIHHLTSLRVWLGGRWAVLFSHPEDFAQEQLEMDRWISVLNRSFSDLRVAPIALARAGPEREQGWLAHLAALNCESATVATLDPSPPGAPADASDCALRAQIARGGPRLAMVIDSELRCRRTLSYCRANERLSPLDLLGWAVALRKRDRAESPRIDVLPARRGRPVLCA